MKVKVNSKKGFKTILSVLGDKKTIQKKLDEKLNELQNKVQLKGFRPGKVPTKIIKKTNIYLSHHCPGKKLLVKLKKYKLHLLIGNLSSYCL